MHLQRALAQKRYSSSPFRAAHLCELFKRSVTKPTRQSGRCRRMATLNECAREPMTVGECLDVLLVDAALLAFAARSHAQVVRRTREPEVGAYESKASMKSPAAEKMWTGRLR